MVAGLSCRPCRVSVEVREMGSATCDACAGDGSRCEDGDLAVNPATDVDGMGAAIVMMYEAFVGGERH